MKKGQSSSAASTNIAFEIGFPNINLIVHVDILQASHSSSDGILYISIKKLWACFYISLILKMSINKSLKSYTIGE